MKPLSRARILRAFRRAPSLCALTLNKTRFSAGSAILSCRSQLSLSAATLSRTVSATLYTAVSYHSISIGLASAATTGGLLLTP